MSFINKIANLSKKTKIAICASAGTAVVVVAVATPLAITASTKADISTNDFFFEDVTSTEQQKKNVLQLKIPTFENFAWYDLKTIPSYLSLTIPDVADYQLFDEFGKSLGRVSATFDVATPGSKSDLYNFEKEKRLIGTVNVAADSKLFVTYNNTESVEMKNATVKKSDLTVTITYDLFQSVQAIAYDIWISNFYQKSDINSTTDKETIRQRIKDLHSDKPTADGVSLYKLDETIKQELEDMYNKMLKARTMAELEPEINQFWNEFEEAFGKEFKDAFYGLKDVQDFLKNGSKFDPLP